MNIAKHATNAIRVDKAPGYFTHSGNRNWEPALLWLVILVVGLQWVRTGRTPTGQEAVTWTALAGGVVVAGAFVPEIVALLLVGLLVAGSLNAAGPLTAAINKLTSSLPKGS
jgi:hypothetical protein